MGAGTVGRSGNGELLRDHGKPHDRSRERRVLRWACLLKTFACVLQVGGGILTGSLALLSDAIHLALDIGGNLVGWVVMSAGERTASRKTQARVEGLGSFLVALLITVASYVIIGRAVARYGEEPEILSRPMFAIATLGLLVNIVNIVLLHPHATNHTIRAVRAHEVTDLLSSCGVMIAAAVIMVERIFWVDTIVSALIGIVTFLWGLVLSYGAGWQIAKGWLLRP